MLIIGLPLCASTAILSVPIVNLLFGRDFSLSAPILAVLACAALVMFLKSISLVVIINSKYFHRFISVSFVYLLVSIGVDILIIHKFGAMGASVSRLITEFIMLVIQHFFCWKVFRRMPRFFRFAIKPCLATLVVGILLYVFRSMPLAILVFPAVALYVVLLLLLKEVSKDEILKILAIFRLRKTA